MLKNFFQSPKVSIILLSYNRADYLPKILESILNQTIPPFELLVLEDNSAQKFIINSIIENYAPEFAKVKINLKFYSNQSTYGLDKNLREGIGKASGDYVCILGNDDFLLPNYISNCIKSIETNPEVKCFSRSFQRRDHITGNLLGKSRVTRNLKELTSTPRPDLIFRSCAFISGLLLHRDSAERVKTDFFDGTLYYQFYLFLMLAIETGVGAINEVCILATVNNNSEFGAAKIESTIHMPGPYGVDTRLAMWRDVLRIADSISYYSSAINLLRYELSHRMAFHVFEMLGVNRRSASLRYFRGLKSIGLRNNFVTFCLLFVNIFLGKRCAIFYSFVRFIVQR